MRQIFKIYFLLSISSISFGQSDTIFLNIKKLQEQKIDSIISFNTDKEKYKYLSLLPSVSYDAFNNSFNVGFSLSGLSNYFQNKQRNKIELEKLRFQMLESNNLVIENLTNKYDLLISDFELYKLELENNKLADEIFLLKRTQFENNKINLEEWLNIQKDNQAHNLLLFAKRQNLINKMKAFQLKIKNSCFEQELNYLIKKIY